MALIISQQDRTSQPLLVAAKKRSSYNINFDKTCGFQIMKYGSLLKKITLVFHLLLVMQILYFVKIVIIRG